MHAGLTRALRALAQTFQIDTAARAGLVAMALGGLVAAGKAADAGDRPDDELRLASLPVAETPAFAPSSETRGFVAQQDCTDCHRVDQSIVSHPVNVVPAYAVPRHMPLTDGKLTCTTCHLEGTADDHARAAERGTAMLRGGVSGAAFCRQCHDGSAMPGRSNHPFVATWAHAQSTDGGEGLFSSRGHSLDAYSHACMTCHDGLNGPGLGHSHPYGIPYDDQSLEMQRKRKSFDLTPAYLLDQRVRLVDKTVSCVSCHSAYTGRGAMLVMDNDRGQLCLTCHAPRR